MRTIYAIEDPKRAIRFKSYSDTTVLQNLLVNISIKSLESLRHEECLKIALALFQVILLHQKDLFLVVVVVQFFAGRYP